MSCPSRGCVLFGYLVESLLTIQGQRFPIRRPLPTVYLCHKSRNCIAVGGFEFGEVFAETLAPYFCVAHRGSLYSSFFGSRIAGEKTASGIYIHTVPCGRQQGVQIFLDHSDTLVHLHSVPLRLFGLGEDIAFEIQLFAGLPDGFRFCPELVAVSLCKMPVLLLCFLTNLDDPEAAVARDVTEVLHGIR